MRWSYKLGRLAGIDVYMHVTFLLLLGWIGLSRLFAGQGVLGATLGVSLVVMVFGIVVLHELGHALAARHYGIPTRDITLLPIGGVARLARMPEDPKQEMVVAAAGPAVNLGLAGVFAAGLYLASGLPPSTPVLVAEEILFWLVGINVVLLAFNLLPAFPMDGGRILRAFLARRKGYLPATETAVRVGRYMALLFAVAGLFHTFTLMLIAAFVWFGGTAELAMVRQRAALGDFGGTAARPEVVPPEAVRVIFVPGRGWVAVRPPPEPPTYRVRIVDVP